MNHIKSFTGFITESLMEGLMGDLHLMAKEAGSVEAFLDQFFAEHGDRVKRNRDSEKWAMELYQSTVNEGNDPFIKDNKEIEKTIKNSKKGDIFTVWQKQRAGYPDRVEVFQNVGTMADFGSSRSLPAFQKLGSSEKPKELYITGIRKIRVGDALNEDYFTGISKSTIAKKKVQMKKQAEMPDDDPAAYKPLPGDTKGKGMLKTSDHTKKYHELYGEGALGVVENVQVSRKLDRRGAPDGLLVNYDGQEYLVVYPADGYADPYGLVMPGDDIVSFLNKDRKAKAVWKKLKPHVDSFLATSESMKHGKGALGILESTATDKLASEIEGAEVFDATSDGRSVQARYTNKTWPDGVPVLKSIARSPKRSVKLPPQFRVVDDSKYGWWYFWYQGTWYGIDQDEYSTPPFEY